MENNKVAEFKRLKNSEIDMHNVFLSLIKQGVIAGVFGQERMEELQYQLMTLTGELVGKFTYGQSSSVKTETAQRILSSAIYIIDLGLMQDFDAEEAAKKLCVSSIAALHDEGIQAEKRLEIEIQQWMERIQEHRLNINMISYNESIHNIAEAFCTVKKGSDSYDSWFDARNAVASIDYPLLFDDMSWEGILYIRNYLRQLEWENVFCGVYNSEEIDHLMSGVAKNSGISKAELLVNIAESTLLNSLCSVLLCRSAFRLRISPDELEQLYDVLSGDRNEVLRTLERAFTTLVVETEARIGCESSDIYANLKNCLPRFAVQLENAVCQRSLNRAIVMEQSTAMKERVLFGGGQRMSDRRLREVIAMLLECEGGEEKLQVILRMVRSVEDLIEVFSAFCIYDQEFDEVFDGLEEEVLVALTTTLLTASSTYSSAFFEQSKQRTVDELLRQFFSFDVLEHTEHQLYWMERLKGYLAGSSKAEAILTQSILVAQGV